MAKSPAVQSVLCISDSAPFHFSLFLSEYYSREVRWLFAALAGFMPQAIFMGTYVNTDSLALLAAAMILYAWGSYLREDWTWKNCILLAVGMAVCALSYYNAYTI